MKTIATLFSLLILISFAKADVPNFTSETDSTEILAFIDSMTAIYDSIENSIQYQRGEIPIIDGQGTLKIPEGFKYVGQEQSHYIMSELYGNPADPTMIGILMPEEMGITYGEGYIFVLYYDAMGYVKDDDAQEIDYEELLDQMREDATEENKERISNGMETYKIIGWAEKPYYDSNKKVLHWAKEIKFESDTAVNTLNYNILILGRKGVLTMNAISTMAEFQEVEAQKQNIINMFSFNEGYQYDDFDSKTDEVAAWTIGGLVAGQILAKVGFFAIILKYIKIIGIGIAAAGAAVWRWIAGRKKKKEEGPDSYRDQPEV